jgi:hypothetical protein
MKGKPYLPGGFFISWARVLLRPGAVFYKPPGRRSPQTPKIMRQLQFAVF